MLCGLQELNVDDWEAHTVYKHYTSRSREIQWFWQVSGLYLVWLTLSTIDKLIYSINPRNHADVSPQPIILFVNEYMRKQRYGHSHSKSVLWWTYPDKIRSDD